MSSVKSFTNNKVRRFYDGSFILMTCMPYIKLCIHSLFSKCTIILDLKGKTLSNKSKLMAQAWRKISTADKEKYNAVANDIEGSNEEEDEEELTPEKKRQLIVRVAKRHQGDVGVVGTVCARRRHI